MKIKSVKYNLIMNMILKMSQFIFPLITFPYVARVLLADGNGKVAFAISVVTYFSMFASLGIPTHGIKICAQYRDDKEDLSRITQEIFIINAITTVVVYVVFFIAMGMVQRLQEEKTLFLICSMQIMLTTIGAEWFFQAIEQYDYITFRNIAFKIVSIVLMFIFVRSPKDYVIYGAITIVGTCGSNVLNFIRLRKYITLKPLGNYDFKRHMKPILVLFLLSISITIYTNLDTVMLGFFKTDFEVGLYNAATKTKGILTGIVTALGTVLLPRISYYIQKGQIKEFKASIRKSIQFVWMLALPIVMYSIVESRTVITFLAGSSYKGATLPMQIITPTILFIGLSNITGIQILIPVGEERFTVLSTMIGAIVDLVLNAIFIPSYGAAGAAFGTLIAEIAVLVVQIIFVKKWAKETIDLNDGIKVLVATIVAFLILVLSKNITCNNSFLELLFTAILFFGSYGILLLVTKEVIVQEVLQKFLKKNSVS